MSESNYLTDAGETQLASDAGRRCMGVIWRGGGWGVCRDKIRAPEMVLGSCSTLRRTTPPNKNDKFSRVNSLCTFCRPYQCLVEMPKTILHGVVPLF